MTPADHARAREIFLQVIAAPDDQRGLLLESLCAQDSAVHAEVQRLLAHHRAETLAQPPPARVLEVAAAGSSGAAVRVEKGRDLPTGTILAERFRIVARLGGGGMGDVYRAEDLALDQTVALKLLPPRFAGDAAWLEQLRREVRVARTVTHPNVCRVFDIAEAAGEQFISMEYVDGEDLASLLRRIGRVPDDKALDIAHQLCAGLAAAHAAGVLHRDLKPANVMLDGSGRVRITDFGLAGSIAELRDDQRIAGTPAYMAPEQITGRGVDERADVYALGLVLYELFTGKPAFAGRSFADFVRGHQTVDPTPPSEIVSSIDPAIENVIRACVSKNPGDRPPSALAVSARLPGGQTLTRMLAAGQTPPPELIAVSSVPFALQGHQVIATFTMALVLLAGYLALGGRGRFDFNVDKMKPPAVLLERARSLASAQRLPDGWHDAWGYLPADDAARALLRTDAVGSHYAFAHDERNELVFWYRLVPASYGPQSLATIETPRPTLRDPPEDAAGMRTVVLDAGGRLIALTQFPQAGATRDDSAGEVNWSTYLSAADLDDVELSSCDAELQVPIYADTRVAWSGAGAASPRQELRVEGASLGDLPLLFVVFSGQSRNLGFQYEPIQRKAIADGLKRIAIIVTLLAALPLARRNLQRGRGDPRTALRLATVLLALKMIEWLLSMGHQGTLAGELRLLQQGLLSSVLSGLAIGMFYLALEPLARRYWPYTLISWTRLLSGRGWDAIVGQHVLLGGLLGVFWATLLAVDRWAIQAFGWGLRPMIWEEQFTLPLLGARYAVALAAQVVSNALIYGLLIMLVLALLRALLRKPIPAALLATLMIALLFLPYGNSARTAWLIVGVGCVGSAIWAVVHYGLLTLISAIFVLGALSLYPMTLRAEAWFSDLTLFALAMVLVSLAGGLVIARRAPSAL